MGSLFCLLSPVRCAGTSVAKSTLGDVFGALTNWVLASVAWLLRSAGGVLTSASEPSTVLRSANQEFTLLVALAPPLMMVGLLVATLQALRQGDSASLARVYFAVAPACVAGIALARPLAALVLTTVNQLSSTAAQTVVGREGVLAKDFTTLSSSTPGFGIFVLAIGVVVGCWLLWCELIVRSLVLTLLLVLVPVVVPLSTFPALRRLGWRLAETFVAVAASKFLIVVALSLGLNQLEGSSSTQIVTGAVSLLLAAASPFLLLRVIPFVEQSALHNLEGLRGRFSRGVQQLSSSPGANAVRALAPEAPIPGPPTPPEDLGLGMWEGDTELTPAPRDGDPGPAPVGKARARGGHVAYYSDDVGPVVGWHFDE
ncbi:MAG TPA: hypothetical protein VMV53_07150 [Acidimicrobiales bacterium]|nr:hypothetical protein [Acidimicrobiales bacterium]